MVEITKPVPTRSTIASHGVGAVGSTALLSPSTAAAIAIQNNTWNDQKIRVRQRGSESRSAAIRGDTTPVRLASGCRLTEACSMSLVVPQGEEGRGRATSGGVTACGGVLACEVFPTCEGLPTGQRTIAAKPRATR